MAERTGCPIFLSLWSYVTAFRLIKYVFLLRKWRFQKRLRCRLKQALFHLSRTLNSVKPLSHVKVIFRYVFCRGSVGVEVLLRRGFSKVLRRVWQPLLNDTVTCKRVESRHSETRKIGVAKSSSPPFASCDLHFSKSMIL
jgi:hypothetical protein